MIQNFGEDGLTLSYGLKHKYGLNNTNRIHRMV